ncbi:MAG: endonuclease V [Candidatus Heimdallarchaeota archaeon]
MDDWTKRIPEKYKDRLLKVREQQLQIAKKLELQKGISLEEVQLVAGFDTAFDDENNIACSAAVTVDIETLETVEKQFTYFKPKIPYVPTFLYEREGPGYKKLFQQIKEEPDVLLFDGNGILHPFGCGLASQMGYELKKPTIGVAKKLLLGTFEGPLKEGGYSEIIHHEQVLGVAFQSLPPPAKPIFISQGNHINLKTAVNVVRFFTQTQQFQKKLPLPLFLAHLFAKEKLGKE